MNEYRREDIELTSRGATLRGWFYPARTTEARAPGIVMAHGFTGVREMFLDRYAEAFAQAGFAVLVYDHFGFGASDGEPRQSPTPSIQLEGYRDAIAALRKRDTVDPDRIGLWGSSYSGNLVIVLSSEELGVRCAVAQVPKIGPNPALSDATRSAITDALKEGRHDTIVPAVTATPDGLGILYEDNSYDWFMRVARERAPTWRNEVRVGAFAEPFAPRDHLATTRIPLRLIVAPDDKLLPPEDGIALARAVPLIDVVTIEGGHFRPYEAGFEESSGLAIDWFTKHLRHAP